MNIDLPTYNGRRNIELFLDSVKSVEIFFDYMGTPEDKKVKLVSLKLKSGALLSGTNYKQTSSFMVNLLYEVGLRCSG